MPSPHEIKTWSGSFWASPEMKGHSVRIGGNVPARNEFGYEIAFGIHVGEAVVQVRRRHVVGVVGDFRGVDRGEYLHRIVWRASEAGDVAAKLAPSAKV